MHKIAATSRFSLALNTAFQFLNHFLPLIFKIEYRATCTSILLGAILDTSILDWDIFFSFCHLSLQLELQLIAALIFPFFSFVFLIYDHFLFSVLSVLF